MPFRRQVCTSCSGGYVWDPDAQACVQECKVENCVVRLQIIVAGLQLTSGEASGRGLLKLLAAIPLAPTAPITCRTGCSMRCRLARAPRRTPVMNAIQVSEQGACCLVATAPVLCPRWHMHEQVYGCRHFMHPHAPTCCYVLQAPSVSTPPPVCNALMAALFAMASRTTAQNAMKTTIMACSPLLAMHACSPHSGALRASGSSRRTKNVVCWPSAAGICRRCQRDLSHHRCRLPAAGRCRF